MSDTQQHTDLGIESQMLEQLRQAPPLTLEVLRRQTIAMLYAIGRVEGVEYKVVTIEANKKQERKAK